MARLSDDERREYDEKIKSICDLILNDGHDVRQMFPSADAMAKQTLPDEPATGSLYVALKGAHLAFTVCELKSAQRKWFAQLAREERDQIKSDTRAKIIGIDPANEREYITAFMMARGYDMNYHREFGQGPDQTPAKLIDIANDARLTAGELGLIKPRGDKLGATDIGIALDEWCNLRRQERFEHCATKVAVLSEDRDQAKIDAAFSQVCRWYASEPEFFEAAIRKVIYSAKRKLKGLPIKHVHMIVIVGPQNTGKTAFSYLLISPLGELACEASLQDILDTRQTDLPTYFILFTDEMVFADRTEPAALKTFMSGGSPSRRPMRMNTSERVKINATLIGTANHSLEKVIFDPSGMRRFVEIKPKSRVEIEPHWQDIVNFDWLGLWQSIDEYADDPLVSKFYDELLVKQERIRHRDNTELWLSTFEPHTANGIKRKQSDDEYAEFFAQDLYGDFHLWETQYDPGYRGTAMQRWGRDLKAGIDSGQFADWTYFEERNRAIYRVKLPVRDDDSSPSKVIALPNAMHRRRF